MVVNGIGRIPTLSYGTLSPRPAPPATIPCPSPKRRAGVARGRAEAVVAGACIGTRRNCCIVSQNVPMRDSKLFALNFR